MLVGLRSDGQVNRVDFEMEQMRTMSEDKVSTSDSRRFPGLARALWMSLLILLCIGSKQVVVEAQHAARTRVSGAASSNPIIPGDHPDPTILRIGKTYWTTSTAGGWAPEFALYRSEDLQHWTPVGAVFPETPAWATGDFWAPELYAGDGQVFVYYVARNQQGVLCVAAASARRPEGPYTDHGPLICQPDGSIDPSVARDESERPFLIWKEDGNSKGQPTPIWAQPLTSDLLHLTGTMTRLIANEPAGWEGGVVEAPYMTRHAGRFYLFYAANACCGTECHYAEGVARSEHLLGPWQKDPDNPIIRPNGAWKCPGHGTAVETPSGEDYFLYHAYPAAGTVYVGRESVLDPITWNGAGWPVVNGGRGPGGMPTSTPGPMTFADSFSHLPLDPEWKWPIRRVPSMHLQAVAWCLTLRRMEALYFWAGLCFRRRTQQR